MTLYYINFLPCVGLADSQVNISPVADSDDIVSTLADAESYVRNGLSVSLQISDAGQEAIARAEAELNNAGLPSYLHTLAGSIGMWFED